MAQERGQTLEQAAGTKPAAVSVCTVARGHEWWVLVIRRADDLREHAGQCGFPGGRPDAQDRSLWETAQRETFEEVGITLQDSQCAGRLAQVTARGSGYAIVPWLVVLGDFPSLVLNRSEVASADWVSGRRLSQSRQMTPAGWAYACPAGTIWGASARIVRQLEELKDRKDFI